MPEVDEKQTKKKAPARKVGTWIMQRLSADGAEWERCAIHEQGERVERFAAIDGSLPSHQQIGDIWGSGRYRIQPYDPAGKNMGWRAPFEIDDPNRPRRDAYAQRPTQPEPPATAAPELAPPVDPLGGLGGLLGSGAGQAIALLSWMQSATAAAQSRADAEAERRHQRAMAEMEQRFAMQQRFAQQEIEAASRRAETSVEQNRAFMQSILELQQQSARRDDDDDDDDDDRPHPFVAALDAMGIGPEERKALVPGVVGAIRKFGHGPPPPRPQEETE